MLTSRIDDNSEDVAPDDGEEDPCVRQVRLGDIVFSQSSIASEFRNGEDIRDVINRLRAMSEADRLAIVNLFPNLHVVPIPYAGEQYLMSLDNRRLHVFRSVLPPDTMITVQNAVGAEMRTIKRKWTSKNDGLSISVRCKQRP